MIRVAIDPGIRGCGVAVFSTENYLCSAGYVKNPITVGNGPEEARHMAYAVQTFVKTASPYFVGTVFLEVPRVYPAGNQKGDQNDLIALAGFIYAIGMLNAFGGADLIRYFPRDWKGTVDKGEANVNARGEIEATGMLDRIIGRLSPEENSNLRRAGALTHNVIDAVGIGLFGLGRLKPKRVFGGVNT